MTHETLGRGLTRRAVVASAALLAASRFEAARAAEQEGTPAVTTSSQKTFVLVHGSWLGPASWQRVSPLLEAAGHSVIAVELPGHGEDATPVAEITLERYVTAVADAIAGAPDSVILAGHSMGGAVISQVAERIPDRIESLVYVAAYLLESGQSIFDIAMSDAGAKIGPELVVEQDKGIISVKPESFVSLFCADAPVEDQKAALAALRTEPFSPLATPITVTPDRFGTVRRAYIRTANDLVISPAAQDRMLAATPCDPVLTLDTGHSPFIAAPADLAAHLLSI